MSDSIDNKWRGKLLALDSKVASLYKVFDKYGPSRNFVSAWKSLEAFVQKTNYEMGELQGILKSTGGYCSVDRIEALEQNLEEIRNMTLPSQPNDRPRGEGGE